MAASGDLINFEIIENQKENIQSLPGGRSARELARIFSPRDPSDKLSSPSPNDTRTLNDAIRQEYEAELQAIGESDDPLDIYDRYVKWALNAYPSAQATAESGLLPLLERAVKSFLSSPHYKNDSRYLRLWLHYIRLFSDSPRETFAFMARHHVGEGLALFYEEFAGWLESVGRWNQADEVYRLGIDREARPAERLVRKYSDFQRRYEQRTQDNGPSSPALPAVRPALAAKVDPFASAAAAPSDPQAQRPSSTTTTAPKTKSGKPKMAIFTDTDPAASQPAMGGATKGWDSIGSMQDRRKENKVEAKPWAGETLKAGKKAAPKEKMTIFRDESKSDSRAKEESQSKPVPEHRIREAINPRTGRRERVFVNLDAVYPDYKNPNHEVSFEELRAIKRGWMDMDWRAPKEPLKQISGNATQADDYHIDKKLPDQFHQKLNLESADESASPQPQESDAKSIKARKLKVREVKAETQTVKMKFDSPTGGKIRRKSTAEPTMTMHTRAATDEIYSIFNQPLKAESQNAAESSDFDDDDYISGGESTGTGRISAASSDFGDDDTTFHRSFNEGDGDSFYEHTQAESVVEGEWTRFSAAELNPETGAFQSQSIDSTQLTSHDADEESTGSVTALAEPQRERFIPEMPEDYAAPSGPYRDPVMAAQNRLPFMTPIVERTEYSLPSMTAARSNLYNTKTPSRNVLNPTTTPGVPQMGNLLATPLLPETPYHGQTLHGLEDVIQSPTAAKAQSGLKPASPPKTANKQQGIIIHEMLCNPVDKSVRDTILNALQSTLSEYPGYHVHPDAVTDYATEIQKYMKTNGRRSKGGDEASFDIPIIDLPGAERSYIIRRELGAGAYAPVYLAESVDSLDSDSDLESNDSNSGTTSAADAKSLVRQKPPRYSFEAIKLEVGPPNAWEFYMIRTVHERLSRLPELSRASDSIIRAHEMHIFKGESILVEDYRAQGTLLDLVNLVRNEGISGHAIGEGGLDEALAMFFTAELFRTVEALHACGVLHGDIKADNCLIRFDDKPASAPFDEYSADPREVHYSPNGSYGWSNKGLSLIDFGRGIDMRAFHPCVQFIADWKVGEHECSEIREMRPWTHQIDLYGLAGTVHVMLFGKYIESTATDTTTKTYRIREPLKRYWEREIWADVFDLLLNPGSDHWAQMERQGNEIPTGAPAFPMLNSMRHLRARMESWLLANAEKKGLGLQIRKLEAIFAERKKKMEKV
ncbi:Mad3/BUB1 homology region 1-domain-containing protein [Aspergillus granulosus]|uniref:Mad3/BUB1 homology region 1-domain-containing protein n=1 Tax=Aspergillus granulosus TaxID=176169 RepID=A0ABR4H5Y9_9EURO